MKHKQWRRLGVCPPIDQDPVEMRVSFDFYHLIPICYLNSLIFSPILSARRLSFCERKTGYLYISYDICYEGEQRFKIFVRIEQFIRHIDRRMRDF